MIQLTQTHHSTGRRVIADSWFGLVKSAVELLKMDLYSIILVKTAHKQFPRHLLGQRTIERRKWVAYNATVNDHKVQACRVRDLKLKDFFSSCRSSIVWKPRKTKYHGLVPLPRAAEEYVKYFASTDVHNYFHRGIIGLEDIWHLRNPCRAQLAGILGFKFINRYLTIKYFSNPSLSHHQFKM